MSVHVEIRSDDTLCEQGQAAPSETDGLLWVYTTTSPLPAEASPSIVVTVKDLPGNSHDMVWSNNYQLIQTSLPLPSLFQHSPSLSSRLGRVSLHPHWDGRQTRYVHIAQYVAHAIKSDKLVRIEV
jgi:hypothetical protein